LYSWAVGIKECFSDDKIQKLEMTSKYVMKKYSKRHSIPREITNWQALREWEMWLRSSLLRKPNLT
jgi:hypothetical protein